MEGIRRMPDSYYHQHYYAHFVYNFFSKDGKQRLVRFRILPADGSNESGKLSEAEQKEAW